VEREITILHQPIGRLDDRSVAGILIDCILTP
jgi:hypothetical protein